jgi:DNA polymerase III delta prime subunit
MLTPIKKPWVLAHAPQLVSEMLFGDKATAKLFGKMVEERDFQSLLIHGPHGTGKSSISYALPRSCGVDEMDILKINCSDEKIEAIRDKVKSFATTMPYGDYKVVRLEEIDGLSQDAQQLLRSLIEEVQASCRFIATCNYLNKVLPPLQDRFTVYHFKGPDISEATLRAAEILEKRNIEFQLDDLDAVVAAAYPSFRKVLKLLEANTKTGVLILHGTEESAADWKLGLLPLLETGDLKAARKLVCENATREEIQDVFRFVYNSLPKMKTLKGKTDQAVILIAQYQDMHTRVGDTEINIAALFCELDAL